MPVSRSRKKKKKSHNPNVFLKPATELERRIARFKNDSQLLELALANVCLFGIRKGLEKPDIKHDIANLCGDIELFTSEIEQMHTDMLSIAATRLEDSYNIKADSETYWRTINDLSQYQWKRFGEEKMLEFSDEIMEGLANDIKNGVVKRKESPITNQKLADGGYNRMKVSPQVTREERIEKVKTAIYQWAQQSYRNSGVKYKSMEPYVRRSCFAYEFGVLMDEDFAEREHYTFTIHLNEATDTVNGIDVGESLVGFGQAFTSGEYLDEDEWDTYDSWLLDQTIDSFLDTVYEAMTE